MKTKLPLNIFYFIIFVLFSPFIKAISNEISIYKEWKIDSFAELANFDITTI